MNVEQVDWRAEAKKLSFRDKAFIGGKFVPAASGETFAAISPIDGSALAQVAACDTEDVDRAVKSARAAFEKGVWADKAPKSRKKILLKLADLIDKNANELALSRRSTSASRSRTRAATNLARLQMRALVRRGARQGLRRDRADRRRRLALITREPIGVVAAIVPWNYPADDGGMEIRARRLRRAIPWSSSRRNNRR